MSFSLVEFEGKVQSRWTCIIKMILDITIKGRGHETIVSRKGILGEEPTGGKAGNPCTTHLHSVALT